ncbi:putative hydrogenase nickel incorporation protein HypA [Bacteroidia bacterium]|nr:putative hydrogenase nickel incorporation protein HypA [Bacteroidia bacterium]
MHEVSIAQGIVELVEKQAKAHQASVVEEVELEIGRLAGIELYSFVFAMESVVKDTILAKARIIRHDIDGEGRCGDCGNVFPVQQLFDPCLQCGSYAVKLVKGTELRVKSIVVK